MEKVVEDVVEHLNDELSRMRKQRDEADAALLACRADLAAGRHWLEARASVLQELAETKAELAAERERFAHEHEMWKRADEAEARATRRVAKLREALEPFAVRMDELETMPLAAKYAVSTDIPVEALRHARAVLKETKGDGA